MKRTDYLSNSRVRPLDENVDHEILEFEKKYKINLPPLFVAFYQTYDGNQSNANKSPWYVKADGRKTTISRDVHFEPYPPIDRQFPTIEYLYNLETVGSALDNYEDDEFKKYKIFPFIQLSVNDLVCIGYGLENQDEVYILNLFYGEDEIEKRLMKVARNIFEHMRAYIEFDGEGEQDKRLYNKLYMNYNENFWRIREDDKA